MKTTRRQEGDITLIRLENDHGAYVELSSLGAGIVAIGVPDRNGRIDNVVLNYANPADYMADDPCMGKIPGRYANRIANGHFTIDGQEYRLAINNGPNALHGGPTGFQNRIWEVHIIPGGVRFTYTSSDGEEGYPGNLTVTAEYVWSENDVLDLYIKAHTDKATVVNLTNHTYWNLKSATAGNVLNHELRLRASRYLPTDDTLIPTGELAAVAGTPMDFTAGKQLGKEIKTDFPALNYGKGYDACWAIDGYKAGHYVADAIRLKDPDSGRVLSIGTTQPGVQIYTGNWLDGSPVGADGHIYHDYDGVAIECQGFPDAPNHPAFPSQLLRPGQVYDHHIRLTFTTE